MSEYEAIRNDLDGLTSSMRNYAGAVDRYAGVVNEQVAALWADNAALRDEVYAVANRLENLTRAVTTDPAEVAAAILKDANRSTLREVAPLFECSIDGCTVRDPHVHDRDNRIIFRGASA